MKNRKEEEEIVGEYPPAEEYPPVSPEIDFEAKRREAEMLSSIQYILEPSVPEAYKEEFRKWEMLMSKTLAVSNIEPEDVYQLMDVLDICVLWMKFGRPDMAIKRIARMIMFLQLRRSVRGFERISQITTRQIVESTQKAERKKRRGFWIFR